MKICPCGDAVQGEGTLCPRCAALRALDLAADATEAEIRKAYRLLVKVWHPDRFQGDEKLSEAADAKLKEINSAFEFLTSTSTERGPWRPPSQSAEDDESSTSQAQSATGESASSETSAGAATTVAMPDLAPHSLLRPAIRIALKTVAVLVALLLCRYLWIAFDAPDPTGGDVARVVDKGKETVLKGTEGPRSRFIDAIERDWHRLVPLDPTAVPPETPQTPQTGETATPASQQPQQAASQKTTTSHPDRVSATPAKILPYITVGSTRDEVLEQQGTPTASSDDKLVYGNSELYFKNGSVVGWRIDPVASPIRVKLWPTSAVDPGLASYTVGSSKDVVLTVQGTPTAFTGDKFEYGKSVVNFHNNKVVSWKEDPDSTPLWAR
jgi:hypothetical protein